MQDEIENATPDTNKTRVLLDKLVKCGPTAYRSFVDVMLEQGLGDLVEQMERPVSDSK